MPTPIRDFNQQKMLLNKIARLPANRRLKYIALTFIVAAILIMLSMLFWMDKMSVRQILFLRGCAGLCALIFLIITAIYLYRTYSKFIKSRYQSSDET